MKINYCYLASSHQLLTHWGRVTHICVSKLTIIGSDNGLSPGRRQAIIWTNAGILLIGPLGTNFSEILIEIYTFSFTKMDFKMSSAKWRPFCLGLNVLNDAFIIVILIEDVDIHLCLVGFGDSWRHHNILSKFGIILSDLCNVSNPRKQLNCGRDMHCNYTGTSTKLKGG